MSRIVFISPSFGKTQKSSGFSSEAIKRIKGKYCSFIAPLAPAIFATLTPPEHTFIFVDEEIETIDYEALEADLVAITAMTVQANRAYQIAGEFTKRGAVVVIGGIHASVMPEEASKHCNSVMIGEGEGIWPTLLEDFGKGTMRKVYRADEFPPVTTLVKPDYSIYKHDFYFTFPLQATKGCPYKCDFCSIKHSSGHRYRTKPVEDVMRDIEEAEKYNDNSKAGVERKSYFFVDDNLYVNREYTKRLFMAMAEKEIIWDGQGTLNTASDDEIVELMAASGCRSFSFGLESISDAALEEANKPKCNIDVDYSTAIKTLSDKGIVPGAFFIVGFDSDDVTIFEETLAFIKTTQLLQSSHNLLTPYPGTELHKRLSSEGRIYTQTWEDYNSWRCVYTPKKMSSEELQAGFFWLGLQTASLDHSKKAIERFWENPAWRKKPTLRLVERLILIFIAKLRLNGPRFKDYRRFLSWAAFHPKARDFRFIMWFVVRNELASYAAYSEHYNPAEKRRARQENATSEKQEKATSKKRGRV
jgi:radical SAM superfamily enzyme YgiQ (UPF0313 family)